MKKIKILVAAHKPYRMPDDPMYLPVQVGAAGKKSIGFVRDDTGENISGKNRNYCELTGLYWLWKNETCDVCGLVHYRRYFAAGKKKGDPFACVLDRRTLLSELERADIILPKKRNYFIETNYSQYVHAHNEADLLLAREIIAERHPEYIKAYDASMRRTKGHRFNMFIMTARYADEYCEWLFDILFELERRLDISGYSDYDARVFGFVAERLLDVWILTKGYPYRELRVVCTEKVNWWKKGTAFLKRKFIGK